MVKLLLDENIGGKVADHLKQQGFDVVSILQEYPGSRDETVIDLALKSERLLVTLDRDFGRLVFVESHTHVGVLYLRLRKESVDNIVKVILGVLKQYVDKLPRRFSVATETTIRIR